MPYFIDSKIQQMAKTVPLQKIIYEETNYFLVLRKTVEGSVKLLSDTQGCDCNSPLEEKKKGGIWVVRFT